MFSASDDQRSRQPKNFEKFEIQVLFSTYHIITGSSITLVLLWHDELKWVDMEVVDQEGNLDTSSEQNL